MPKKRLKVYKTYTPTAKKAQNGRKIYKTGGAPTASARVQPVKKTN